MIDGKNNFNHPVKNYLITYKSIWKIATGQGDDYTTVCLLDYNYFKSYKMIATDLSNQKALDVDPKSVQQINFTENINQRGQTTMFFIIEEAKKAF